MNSDGADTEAELAMAEDNALWLFVALASIFILLLFNKLRKSSGLVPELNTKAVLITGCDSGFGHELAKRLDKLGVTVFAGCLFPEDDGAKELKSACSSRLHILHLDVTREDHVQEVFKEVKESLGNKNLWAVVNNAGIAKAGLMEWMSTEAAKKIFEVNVFGAVTVTNAFLPLLKISHGRVVIVSSLAGRITFTGMGLYAMSKHAVVALANVLRFELRQWGITVHDIQPGFFRTNMTSMEFVTKEVESAWSGLSEDVRATYGQKFLERYQKTMRYFLEGFLKSNNKYKVIDDLQDAIFGNFPKNVYHPGLRSKLLLSLVYLYPLQQLIAWALLLLMKTEFKGVKAKFWKT